ncbi:MFS transporter [Algoriphagus marinus]|uniref:MFS transporter n=1 Tax=Algoriphagus marinus TaxID=1925762 RepID=UPI000AD2AB5C|nr:MFS transporter [Algoriphagus marinus]
MKPGLNSRSALILIVIAQFLGTSLWFAGNAVAPELGILLGKPGIISWITSAVQLGFIAGTLVFAFLSIPDRFPPAKVFLYSAILASFFNILITILPLNLAIILTCRFLVGFFLAGIYPVGMKIAADYFEKGLGAALGFLVGALALGTAFPYLIKGLNLSFDWKITFYVTSLLTLLGGLIISFFVPSGPYRKSNLAFDIGLIPKLSKIKGLKSAASGYFGHMWEMYTFWAFLPLVIVHLKGSEVSGSYESLLTFFVIAAGAISCAVGGLLSNRFGSRAVATTALIGSGICCLTLILVQETTPEVWISLLILWGILITADSPQFSTLVAQSVIPEYRGTALTLVNSLGFFISVVSIQFAQVLLNWFSIVEVLSFLVIGPILGLSLFRLFYLKAKASPKTY